MLYDTPKQYWALFVLSNSAEKQVSGCSFFADTIILL